MPSRADWAELARQTIHGVDRHDVADLYKVEWRLAADALIAEHRAAIESERSAFKRFFRKANAVLYGLTRRLAPARRLLFALAVLVALLGPMECRVARQS